MYSVSVRDHFMVAHSFTGQVFGPAQRLHGATYVVDVEFRRPSLSEHGLVIDIGLAASALKDVLGEFNYQNLDEISSLSGTNTTTELLAGVIYSRISDRIDAGVLGSDASGLTEMSVRSRSRSRSRLSSRLSIESNFPVFYITKVSY